MKNKANLAGRKLEDWAVAVAAVAVAIAAGLSSNSASLRSCLIK